MEKNSFDASGDSMNIGTACKQIAKAKRVSAAEISKATGISQSYLSMLFNGRIDDPQLKKMYLIAHALDTSADEIVEYAMRDDESHDAFGMTFYQTFVHALEVKGMTIADVCEKTGIYPSYFSKLKNGHMKDVTWERALTIIDALGMTLDEFYALQRSFE